MPVLIVTCLVLGLTGRFWTLGDGSLQDPFHLGELFAPLATWTASTADPSITLPLTIHGLIDMIPGRLVELVSGATHHFLPTVVLYAALNSLASVLALAVVDRLRPASCPTRPGMLLTTALVAPLCVSYHSIFLLTALLLHLMLRDRHTRDGAKAPAVLALEFLLGLTVAFGLHISFDRGLATAVAFGAAYLPLPFMSARRTQPGLVALVTFCAAAALGALLHPLLGLAHYIENVTFLAATAAQWRYPWSQQTAILTGTLIFLVAAAGTLAFQAWRHPSTTPAQQKDLIIISVLILFLLRIGTNRADISHIVIGLSGPLLMAAWWHAQPNLGLTPNRWTRAAHLALIAGTLVLALPYKTYPVVAASVALSLATLARPHSTLVWRRYAITGMLMLPVPLLAGNAVRHAQHGQFNWAARLLNHPDNAALSPAGVRWAAASLRSASVTCVFDLSNNGLIQALVQKPACSRITYPVYGGPDHEAELVDALTRQQPAAVVYSSTHWAYSIDQRPMSLRFPALDRYVRANYPVEHCDEGYCVRLREKIQ